MGDSTSDPQMRCVSGHINLRLQMQQNQVFVVSRAKELNLSKDVAPKASIQIPQGTLAQGCCLLDVYPNRTIGGANSTRKSQPGLTLIQIEPPSIE